MGARIAEKIQQFYRHNKSTEKIASHNLQKFTGQKIPLKSAKGQLPGTRAISAYKNGRRTVNRMIMNN
jgi:hypothetical protein